MKLFPSVRPVYICKYQSEGRKVGRSEGRNVKMSQASSLKPQASKPLLLGVGRLHACIQAAWAILIR